MDLRQEVAQVACRLGFRPKLYYADGGTIEDLMEKEGEEQVAKEVKEKIGEGEKSLASRRSRARKAKESNASKRKKNKGKDKLDSYDKKALLEILSGPDESSTTAARIRGMRHVFCKRERDGVPHVPVALRKVRSIVPKGTAPMWHVALDELEQLPEDNSRTKQTLSHERVQQKRQEAEDLCRNEADAFEYRLHSSKKQGKWLLQVKEKGTHLDRIAAYSLMIRDSVVANANAPLDYLLSLAVKQKGSRELVIHALKALAELFRCFLLPDRKLSLFESRPLHLLKEDALSKLYLIFWSLEDRIKRKFAQFVSILESAAMAPLEHLRSEAITLISDLLYDKPEQEAELLRILIHKLGDRVKKVGSKVAFLISKLIQKHPRMKLIVLKEVEKFVYSTGTTIQSVRCVLQTFNSIEYDHNDIDKETATRYIDMCFTIFKQMVDGNMGSRVDLKRKAENKSLSSHSRRRKQSSARHAERKTKFKEGSAEVDATVFSALISGIRRSLPFADSATLGDLLEIHTDAFFRLVHVAPFNVSIQVLALLYQILPVKATCLDRLYRAMYEKILDPNLSESRKLSLFISTVFKAIKDDPNLSRAMAFVKRLLQVALHSEPHLCCAFLLVISEATKFKPGLKSNIIQPEDSVQSIDIAKGGRQRSNTSENGNGHSSHQGYKINHREPIYCGADDACLWELCAFLPHYHPVAHSMAESMLSKQQTSSTGDPLQEFTLFTFLEKFVNRKDSKMKRVIDARRPTTPGTTLAVPYHDPSTFASLATQDVPVEDVFFHKYYNIRSVKQAREARQTAKSTKKTKIDHREKLEGGQEEKSFLQDDEDLESMESLDISGDEVGAGDIDGMFAQSIKEEKQPHELFDYSDLLEDMQKAYAEPSEDSDDAASMSDLEQQEDSIAEEDEAELEDLEAAEFPELSSDSSDGSVEEPVRKRMKRVHTTLHQSDFAPAEDYAAFLDSDGDD